MHSGQPLFKLGLILIRVQPISELKYILIALMPRLTGCIEYGRVSSLDNINYFLHSKYTDIKIQGMCHRGNQTNDLLRAVQGRRPNH